jgi:protein TonB
MLKAVSLKEEKAIPSPQPLYKQEASLKTAQLKPIEPHIGTIKLEGFTGIGCADIPPPVEEDSISIKEDDSDKLMSCNLETEAEYPGGPAAWQRFLSKNLKCPTDSSGNGIPGTVVVQFIVNEDGNVTDVKAISGSEPLSTEAVRVIKKSSKWTPGRQVSSGRYIKSIKKQPIVVRGEE